MRKQIKGKGIENWIKVNNSWEITMLIMEGKKYESTMRKGKDNQK